MSAAEHFEPRGYLGYDGPLVALLVRATTQFKISSNRCTTNAGRHTRGRSISRPHRWQPRSSAPATYFPIYTRGGVWHQEGELWTDWTGGFFAGLMWRFFRHTGRSAWRERAEHFSRLLEPRQHDRHVHDLGFIFLNTYRPWFELDGRPRTCATCSFKRAARSPCDFRSGGNTSARSSTPESLFIDIMMNVPLIFYAASETSDGALRRIAEAHCRTTRDTLVRPDGSTAHEGIFDTQSGRFLRQSTHQGLRGDSRWARGLAWSMYGFSQSYALSGQREFLAVAERNADFWLTHLPKDHVPYWDFDADPEAPLPWGPQKDSSAAAIAASGLLDLERQTDSLDRAASYRQAALAMLDALCTSEYLASATPRLGGNLEARRLSHGQRPGR